MNEEGIAIECPSCDGRGCEHCKDGMMEIDGCPKAACRGIGIVIDAIEMFNKGLAPVVGGSLDQAYSFIQAAKFYESADIKARPSE